MLDQLNAKFLGMRPEYCLEQKLEKDSPVTGLAELVRQVSQNGLQSVGVPSRKKKWTCLDVAVHFVPPDVPYQAENLPSSTSVRVPSLYRTAKEVWKRGGSAARSWGVIIRHSRGAYLHKFHFNDIVPYESFANTNPPSTAIPMLSKVPIKKYSANRCSFNSGNLAIDFPAKISPTIEGD